ncbi:MAG: hypothetical protein ACYC7D_15865 [Nitrososphaerales archaeon]
MDKENVGYYDYYDDVAQVARVSANYVEPALPVERNPPIYT